MTESIQSLDLKLDVAEVRQELAISAEKSVDPELEAKATQFADMLASLDPNEVKARGDRKFAVESAGRELQKKAGHRSRMLQA